MAIPKHRTRRRRRPALIDGVAVALVVAGVGALSVARLAPSGPPAPRVSGRVHEPAATRSMAPASSPSPDAIGRSRPVQLSIPAIGVRTPLIRLGLEPNGTLQVPTDFSVAGWYDLGPSPGEVGPAVIVGHVDSTAGPAVFYRLGQLTPGETVQVAREDGTEVPFRVYAVREFVKADFPTALVYGPTEGPELRLITCGGGFDSATGHYLDNIVVFARSA
ncbi:MAG TPA: class F sortase [Actinomycetota bacterium]|nr:class F sortase [Actinomycetota bacterium]